MSNSELYSIQQKILMLNESEKLAGVGSWIWDVENDIWTFSDNWYTIHGFDKKLKSTNELLEIAHPDDQEQIQKALNEVIDKQIPYEIEHRIIKQNNNEIRIIKAFGKVAEVKNGKITRIIGAALDITEFKNTQKLLEEKDEISNNIFNNSSAGIFRSTPEGKVLSANPAFLEIYGFKDLNKLLETPVVKLYANTKDRQKVLDHLKNNSQFKNFITKERKKDGSEIWVKTNYSATKNSKGEIIYIDGQVEDITEQINSENKLIELNKQLTAQNQKLIKLNSELAKSKEISVLAEEKFRNLFSSIRDAIVVADKSRKISQCNQAFLELFEYSEDDIIGQETAIMYKDREEFQKVGTLIKENIHNPNFLLTVLYKKKTGEMFPGETSVFYLKNEEGETQGFIGVIRDITERKQSEEKLEKAYKELKESEQRFKALHQASFGGIIIHDKGPILDCNQMLEIITGYSSKELLGMNSLLLVAKECRDLVREKINSEYEGSYRITGLRKNGEKYPLLVEAKMIQNRGKVARVVEYRDITDQTIIESELKIAKEKAEENEKKFKIIFNQAPLGIAVINSHTGFIHEVNPTFAQIAGRTIEQMQNIDWMSITHPDDVQEDLDNMALLNKGEIDKFQMEKRYIRPDGSLVWINMAITPLKEKNIENKRHLAMIEDISDRKTIENELKIAKEKAEQSDRLKTEFLNNMSHEIRTPLNGILGFSRLLNRENLNTEQRKEYIDTINDSGYRLTKVVEDIIDISMIDSNQMEINKSLFNLNEFLNEIFDRYQASKLLKSNPNISLYLHNSVKDSQMINSDKLRLNQVMDHLITNALKWTSEGKIEIGCSYNDSNQIKISIKDEGKGIPKDQQHKLFKRFSKIKTEELNEGTGVGLAISTGIINLLDGTMWHEDNKPFGAIFYFVLPLDISEQEPELKTKIKEESENVRTEEEKTLENKLIYIAEDDEISAKYLNLILSDIGAKLKFANNGEELIKLIEEEIPDIILLDIKMPKLNGFETLAIIKSKYPQLKVIAQTAHAMEAEINEIMKAGFDAYIPKPIDEDELKRLIGIYMEL